MRKITVLLGMLLLLFVGLRAADIKSIGIPYVRNYTKNNYQSGNQNWSITKDEHGVMYFGNSEGLLTFDGRYWQQYALPNKLIIRSVAADGHGRVYTGAFGDFGYWANNQQGTLSYTSLSKLIPSKVELTDEVWKIYIDGDRVIFQSFASIFIYRKGKITIVKDHQPYLFLLRAGKHFFLGQVDGKGLYELKGSKLESVAGGDKLGTVLSILPFGQSRFVIGTAKKGLFLYDGKTITPWKTQADELLIKAQLNNGVVVPGKYIAYGTILNGVIIIDTAGHLIQHINKLSGLQNNTVLSLYLDNEQNLWAGLDNGIDCIEINSPLYFYFDKGGQFGTVYSSIIHDNKIYLGTNQGLFYSDWFNSSNKLFQSFDFKLIPGSQGQVWDLSLIDGQLLCGHNDGTFKVNGDKISQMANVSGGWTIKKLKDDHLIQGTYTGLAVYKKDANDNWVYSHKVEGFGEPSRYVEPAEKNQVWVSHVYKGIYRVTLSADLKKAVEVKYYGKSSGLPDSYNIGVFNLNGRVVFSSDNGFYIYDDITDKFYKYDQLNKNLGAFSNSNKIIAAYGKKYWFINHGRVAMADFSVPGKLSLNTHQLNILNGRMVQYYENISRINDAIYLISVDDGFVIFNDIDASRKDSLQLPKVLIRKIESISDKSIVIGNNNGQNIEIPFDNNSIRISYTLPYYKQAKVRFQYLLKGYSKHWSDWTGVSQKEFANLPHGDYVFQIRAQVDDDNYSAISDFSFTILAPWYLSTIAFPFYLGLLVLAYYVTRYYYRLKLERHRKQLIEKLQAEKEEYLKQEAIAKEQEIVRIKNEQLQTDLDAKSRELANSAMNIVYKNELLQNISTGIADLKDAEGKKLTGEQLRRIQKVIDDGMTDERDWNLFENSFNEAHENFFKKLKAQHPDLVPNDLKLCAYLRMNMSSKELASLLNISLRGVEIRRYRLRKKLDLQHDKNLVEFLMEL